MGKLADAAEGQKRAESQRCGRVSVFKRVANQNAVFVVLEEKFLLQNHAADTVNRRRNLVAVEFANVFVPFRAVVVALILVQAQIEFCPVLHHRAVQRREQNVVFVVDFGHGNHQQTVVFSDVAIDNRRTRIRARAIGSQQFLWQ